jgi:hypothetical protein
LTEELAMNFKRDLASEPARKVHAALRSLDLPTIKGHPRRIREQGSLGARAGS